MKRIFLYLMVLVMMFLSIEGCYVGWWDEGGRGRGGGRGGGEGHGGRH